MGRLSTVDLLVLTSLDQLLFILKILLIFFTIQATLMRGSTVLILPPKLVFPVVAEATSVIYDCNLFITLATSVFSLPLNSI